MIVMPNVFIVGGTGRHVGKTAFVCALSEQFGSQRALVAVKITTIDSRNRDHHPPVTDWIIEERNAHGGKDTSRMLASGAKRALWLQVPEARLQEGIPVLLNMLGPETPSIWESTRACRLGVPGAFVMVESPNTTGRKPWAAELERQADRIVSHDHAAFDIDWSDIQCIGGRWSIRMNAAAVLLAGGGSTRMGVDKTMLPVNGKPMIQHIRDQLRPWFARILISSNNRAHGFLGEKIIPDQTAGRGPLMGIVSALRASPYDLCFVMACDIPEIDIRLVRSMVHAASDCDVVAPYSRHPEPLFAVYRKNTLPILEQMLSSGNLRVTDALKRCRVKYVPIAQGQIRNVNTMSEYCRYIGATNDTNP